MRFLAKFASDEKKIGFAIFLFSLALYLLFVANGLNFFDMLSYRATLRQAAQTGDSLLPFTAFGTYGPGSTAGLGRSSFYVLLSYPYFSVLTKVLGIDPDFALNSLSAVVAALSTIFVFKTSRLSFTRKYSIVATLLYVFTPLVFFLGINSFNYTPLLLFSSVWFYYLYTALKTGEKKYSFIASVALVADIFVHPISLPLLLPHAYVILKMNRKFSWIIKHALILSPVALLLFYFTFVNPAYPVGFKLPIFAFTVALFGLELANGLSLPFFLAFCFSLIMLLRKFFAKKTDQFDILFLLTLISLTSLLIYWNFAPVVRFAPLLPILSIFVMRNLRDVGLSKRHFELALILIAVFMLVKFVPIAYEFHVYPSPHKVYAQWDSGFSPSLLLVGHECPWIDLYTNLTFFCRSVQAQNISIPNTGAYVTEEYYTNENQLEFEYMVNLTKLPIASQVTSEISRADILQNRTVTKIAVYDGNVRPFEDVFQWLFSMYPNPFQNLIVNTKFLKPAYAIYRVS